MILAHLDRSAPQQAIDLHPTQTAPLSDFKEESDQDLCRLLLRHPSDVNFYSAKNGDRLWF